MIDFIIKTFFNKKTKKKIPLVRIKREVGYCMSKILASARPVISKPSVLSLRQTCEIRTRLNKTVLSKYFIGLEGLKSCCKK